MTKEEVQEIIDDRMIWMKEEYKDRAENFHILDETV